MDMINSLGFNLEMAIGSFMGLATAIPTIIELIKVRFHIHGTKLVALNWSISIIICLVLWFLDLGFMSEVCSWYYAVAIGVGLSLMVNLVATTEVVQKTLSATGVTAKKKKSYKDE